MHASVLIEAVGYLGSILVLVSFLMTSVVKLRIVNAIGGLICAVYALLIHSYPTAIMNFCLVGINLRFLWRLGCAARDYRLVPVSLTESYVKDFLNRYGNDIAVSFPGRGWDTERLNRAWLCCSGASTAGILLGCEENGVLDVALDYTTPAFRDCSVGAYLLRRLPGEGVREIRYAKAEPGHVDYLKKTGWVQDGDNWRKELQSSRITKTELNL